MAVSKLTSTVITDIICADALLGLSHWSARKQAQCKEKCKVSQTCFCSTIQAEIPKSTDLAVTGRHLAKTNGGENSISYLVSQLVVLLRWIQCQKWKYPWPFWFGDLGSNAAGNNITSLSWSFYPEWLTARALTTTVLLIFLQMHLSSTYSWAVVVAQKAQVDLAVQVDGCIVGEGKHPERETSHSGDAVLNQFYCTVCWIRTPGRNVGGVT